MTDKSNRFVAVDNDIYLLMGKEHTDKDFNCTIEDAQKFADVLDRNTSMLLKILNMGGNETQMTRFRESYMKKEGFAPMELTMKDHKELTTLGLYKTRPIVNGSNSFAAGANELPSIVLKAIIEAKENKHSVKSSEEIMKATLLMNEMVKQCQWKIYT